MRGYQGRRQGYMDYESFKTFVDANKPYYLGFHGWGEPLLHEKICDMVAYAASKGAITSLITNGTLVDSEILQKLYGSKLRELAFGVYRVKMLEQISGNVEKATDLKRKMGLKNLKIFLDITAYEGNREEIRQIIEHGARLGIDAVNIHRIFNLHNPVYKALCKDDEAKLFEEIRTVCKRLSIELTLPREHTSVCRIAKYCIFVTWDFKVTPCCFLPDHVLAQGPNIKIADVIKSHSYREFLNSMSSNPVCSKCIM